MKKALCFVLAIAIMLPFLVFGNMCKAKTEDVDDLEIQSPSYVLIEKNTGKILCEKNKDIEKMPASITKIMSLILIFEALDQKKITLQDQVTVSEYAASMGGSQVYLESGEVQTVEDLIKCIVIASANDACVAMAEYVDGSEQAFVKNMNRKAKELGMKHTFFSNCCGLDDTLSEEKHHSSAYDIALMSRELLFKHEDVKKYTTVWMDSIIHRTKKGEKEFGLSNTNKLIRTYNGITGLKTGSTSKAKFCLSASAEREGMELIAVVMSAPTPKDRFFDAAKLLDYGFANCQCYEDGTVIKKNTYMEVSKGKTDSVEVVPKEAFRYVCEKNEQQEDIKKKVIWNASIIAPVKQGQEIGCVVYYCKDREIGQVPLVAKTEVKRAMYKDCFYKELKQFFVMESSETLK